MNWCEKKTCTYYLIREFSLWVIWLNWTQFPTDDSNRPYLQKLTEKRSLSLVLLNLFLVELIFKGFLNLFSTKPTFHYHKMLKFWGLSSHDQKQLFADALQNGCSYRKTPKRRFQPRCFPVNIAKNLRIAFLIEHLWWLCLSDEIIR